MKRTVLFLLALLAATMSIHAQQHLLRGNVVNEKTGEAIMYATVRLMEHDTVLVAGEGCLDENGNVVDFTAAEERQVTLGRNDDNYIEIVDGLEEGEIILAPSPQGSSMMETIAGMS